MSRRSQLITVAIISTIIGTCFGYALFANHIPQRFDEWYRQCDEQHLEGRVGNVCLIRVEAGELLIVYNLAGYMLIEGSSIDELSPVEYWELADERLFEGPALYGFEINRSRWETISLEERLTCEDGSSISLSEFGSWAIDCAALPPIPDYVYYT